MSTATKSPEQSCEKVFDRLRKLAEELKKHDHPEIHFNILHSAQYVDHRKVDVQFKAQARLVQADVAQEVTSTLDSCNEHLKDCHILCMRMGTSQWTADSNARLTMSWNFFFTYLSKVAILLQLELLDAQVFLGLHRQPPAEVTPSPVSPPQSSTPNLSFARRESILSNGGSENFTIEERMERSQRAERQRQAKTQQNPLLVTRTGNKLRKSTSRAPSIILGFSDSGSTISSDSGRSSLTVPSSLPQVPEEKTPAVSIPSIPRTPPPEYSRDDWDAKTLISMKDDKPSIPITPKATPSIRSVASEPQLSDASFGIWIPSSSSIRTSPIQSTSATWLANAYADTSSNSCASPNGSCPTTASTTGGSL
ncbi:hypothetical protein FGSG_11175 [Fusarium graminearum PH-1]|uniref:Chromosome 3, complete genome n=1 Tax=Gibberella zeae (strain ATCC MYA-4620 / CBS 123657 / FGSC 9075 / NRRL 31084 / PH-1) TaxID=229533 RepID=I1S314_GIBZE|nr:hypothetical protein FGSG_11175 [Fusarium graminearum PH-1]ESU17548.1 hypothetical protein FGSG_11175 [Fusarium graminearum PH-1]CEF86887.1 unnamed protein product [Fusarium graminearum]|eukprot:XP_011325170.1 hypothetical protein FGSG_11175 [Fusarium graminearum PH-1]